VFTTTALIVFGYVVFYRRQGGYVFIGVS